MKNLSIAGVLLFGLLTGPSHFTGRAEAANSTVNVTVPQELALQLIASTTAQYLGILKPSAFFPNTYSLTITGKNPAYEPPLPPQTVGAPQLLSALVAVSTGNYVYGWASGMEYGRVIDMNAIIRYEVNCSTPSVFGSTTVTAGWHPDTCGTALRAARNDINQLNYSTPVPVGF